MNRTHKPSKLPPREPGYYIFHGIWRSTRPGTIKQIHEPVKVMHYPFPTFAERVLAVALAGKARTYPVTAFEGTWERISLEIEAA